MRFLCAVFQNDLIRKLKSCTLVLWLVARYQVISLKDAGMSLTTVARARAVLVSALR